MQPEQLRGAAIAKLDPLLHLVFSCRYSFLISFQRHWMCWSFSSKKRNIASCHRRCHPVLRSTCRIIYVYWGSWLFVVTRMDIATFSDRVLNMPTGHSKPNIFILLWYQTTSCSTTTPSIEHDRASTWCHWTHILQTATCRSTSRHHYSCSSTFEHIQWLVRKALSSPALSFTNNFTIVYWTARIYMESVVNWFKHISTLQHSASSSVYFALAHAKRSPSSQGSVPEIWQTETGFMILAAYHTINWSWGWICGHFCLRQQACIFCPWRQTSSAWWQPALYIGSICDWLARRVS